MFIVTNIKYEFDLLLNLFLGFDFM